MPFTDLKGAARLIQRIDEIIALVRSWPMSEQHDGCLEIPQDDPSRGWDAWWILDAQVGGLITALGLHPPDPQSRGSIQYSTMGKTQIVRVSRFYVERMDEWESRLIWVKHAAQEILDVAGSGDQPTKSDDQLNASLRTPVTLGLGLAPPVLTVSLNPPQAVFKGNAIALKPDGATLLKALVDANGDWVAAHTLNVRGDRVLSNLPPEFRALIESVAGKGYRIPREKLA
jgi:hypothetical protein